MSPEILGNAIKAKRTELGMTQEEFGNKLGVSKMAVCKWERGKCYPDTDIQPKLSKFLNITMPNTFQSNTKNEKKGNTMTNLLDIHTVEDYGNLCKQISNDFKARHPDYREPIQYMIYKMIIHVIGTTIYQYYGNIRDCNYETASYKLLDCFEFTETDANYNYITLFEHNLEEFNTYLYKHYPSYSVNDDEIIQIGEIANDNGYDIEKNVYVVKRTENNRLGVLREIKDNSFISEFQIAVMQLEDLFDSY